MGRHHEITRLEGFSDAVFAFALTLLVVSLEVPKDVNELLKLTREFLPFAAMFAMICWIWYEHQQFFSRYALLDAGTMALNCLLLFVVLFYVYPLKFLTRVLLAPLIDRSASVSMDRGDLVMLLYSGGVVLIFGTFVALYRRAWRKRAELSLTDEDLISLRDGMRGHIVSTGLGACSIMLVVVYEIIARKAGDPNTGTWLVMAAGFVYALMGPLHAWSGSKGGKELAALKKKQAGAIHQ